jgi:hypothetical protein
MPDIEKRLEAFVRVGHGIVIFPGGAGTMEELLYLLGILMHPRNSDHVFPLVLTGPSESENYFSDIDQFIRATLGPDAQPFYNVIIDDPAAVASTLGNAMEHVKAYRHDGNDPFYFNWRLFIEEALQHPFSPTHKAMSELDLTADQDGFEMAANLRRAFSGIVAGNVKEDGIKAVEKLGPFVIHGNQAIVNAMDRLLVAFAEQNRMKLLGDYSPCYQLVS